MRAIVIDDSRAMRGLLKRVLIDMGFDGKEGLLRVADGQRPELALVDWNMPNMNGLQFVQAIRQDHAFDDMRIVMVTTEVEMNQIKAALDAGANEYVMKPFTEESLREKIEMLGISREAA